MSLILPLDVPEGKSITKIEDYVTNPEELKEDIGQIVNKDSARKFAIHEALWQCQSLFNDVKGKVAFKKIILFTTNDDPHVDDSVLKKQAWKKANDLNETGVVLEIIPMSGNFDW